MTADFDPAVLAVDPEVASASRLDKSFYLDPGAWAMARERLFSRSWPRPDASKRALAVTSRT